MRMSLFNRPRQSKWLTAAQVSLLAVLSIGYLNFTYTHDLLRRYYAAWNIEISQQAWQLVLVATTLGYLVLLFGGLFVAADTVAAINRLKLQQAIPPRLRHTQNAALLSVLVSTCVAYIAPTHLMLAALSGPNHWFQQNEDGVRAYAFIIICILFLPVMAQQIVLDTLRRDHPLPVE